MDQQCESLLQNQDQSTYYCLTLKLWNEPCPKRCQNRVVGKIGSFEDAEVKGYDIECLEMNRKITLSDKNKQPTFFCGLYELPEPFCKECTFARYTEELMVETDLLE